MKEESHNKLKLKTNNKINKWNNQNKNKIKILLPIIILNNRE